VVTCISIVGQDLTSLGKQGSAHPSVQSVRSRLAV